jgi:hypothetical protein
MAKGQQNWEECMEFVDGLFGFFYKYFHQRKDADVEGILPMLVGQCGGLLACDGARTGVGTTAI